MSDDPKPTPRYKEIAQEISPLGGDASKYTQCHRMWTILEKDEVSQDEIKAILNVLVTRMFWSNP